MGIPATVTYVGGWTVGPVVGRRPAGVARDAVHPGTGARGVLVVVDGRFTGRALPDPDLVQRAAAVGSPVVMPMLDAGLLEDGTRWYVTPPSPGPVLDPSAGCSPRRAAAIVEVVARGLAAVHAAGLVHGLIGPEAVVPALGRHAERPVSSTLLLDTGVAALLGDRAGELAQVAGVALPNDRGPAADVHALGALLLRLLTAAAPAGPALAALPLPLRGLLSAMLDDEPSRRPTADAVARSLAGMREGLLGTGPLPRAAAPAAAAAAVPVPAAAPPPQALVPVAAVEPRVVVPPPVSAPHTLESPIIVPITGPTPAPSLWTGAVPVSAPMRPGRRRAARVLLLAGGVGMAGLIVGVVTHLPLTGSTEERALAAGTQQGAYAAVATRSPDAVSTAAASTGSSSGAPSTGRPSASGSAPAGAPSPAFVRPTAAVPSPLTASASSPTPSRNTSTAPRSSAPTPSSSGSSGSSSAPSSSGSSTSPASDPGPSAESSSPAAASTSPTDTGSSSAPDAAASQSAPSDPSPADSTSTDSTPSGSTPSDSTPAADPSPADASSDAPTS